MTAPAALSGKDALIAALPERIEVLVAQNAALVAENTRLTARMAELEAKLGLPPKAPDDSSLLPSEGLRQAVRGRADGGAGTGLAS